MAQKYVEVRFKMPTEYFKVYEAEAKELTEVVGYKISGTSRIRTEAIKQAKIKLNQTEKK